MLNQEKVQFIKEQRILGKSLRDIGKLLGVSHQAISNYCLRYGLSKARKIKKELPTYEERFQGRLEKYTERREDGCWIWKGTRVPSGYGRIYYIDSYEYVHRLSYIRNVGEIPKGHNLTQTCGNTACWNPEHLKIKC